MSIYERSTNMQSHICTIVNCNIACSNVKYRASCLLKIGLKKRVLTLLQLHIEILTLNVKVLALNVKALDGSCNFVRSLY